jgi:hypothetical protein
MTRTLERIPFYPFLAVCYPVAFLLSVNKEEIDPSAGLRSLLVFLLLGLGAFLFSLLLTRNLRKAGLNALVILLTFFLIFFVLYAPVYRGLRDVSLGGQVLGRHRYLVPATLAFLLLTALAGWLALRKASAKKLGTVTFALNLLVLALFLIPSLNLGVYALKKNANVSQANAALPEVGFTLPAVTQSLPDVYYIILDMHTSDHVMQKLMDYDDSGFTADLRERGFYVPECSRSNYSSTQFSITSSLNMEFLQDISDSYDPSSLYPLLQSSRVRRALESAGYKTYAFESGYSFSHLLDADHYYQPVSGAWDLLTYPGVTPFESLIMQVSGGRILYETRDQLSQKMQYIIDASYVEYRDRILFTLDTLHTLPAEPGPKFVFAHILAPHDPFVFDEDGSTAFRRTPFALNEDPEFREGYGWEPYSKAYVKEVIYLHKRLLEIVDQILVESTVPPVIILQGDHGVPRSAVDNAQFEIYNAIYMKDIENTGFYNTLTPVNTFRLVFNRLYDTGLPLMADNLYLYDKVSKQFSPFEDQISCP